MTNNAIGSDYRFERKFFITELSKYEIENIVKLHSAMFSEVYYERFINNIYFDTHQMNNLSDNLEGATNRIKVRVRWYGELLGVIEKPIMEVKVKNGLLGKKISLPLKPFTLSPAINIDEIIRSVTYPVKEWIADFRSLNPVLINRYTRKYFESADKKYRITLDYDQFFYRVNNTENLFLEEYNDAVSVILELKYDKNSDGEVNKITSEFPFRLSKSSKYVNGLSKILRSSF